MSEKSKASERQKQIDLFKKIADITKQSEQDHEDLRNATDALAHLDKRWASHRKAVFGGKFFEDLTPEEVASEKSMFDEQLRERKPLLFEIIRLQEKCGIKPGAPHAIVHIDPVAKPKSDPDDISKAIGIFSNDPNLSDREVARRAGIKHASKLTRSQRYRRVKETFAASPPPRGSKDGKTRHVEAYE